MKKVMLILIILFCSVSHSFGNAKQEVTTLVNDQVNSLLEILKDNSISQAEKGNQIIEAANKLVDFRIMSRFSLGKHWKKMNKKQRAEFVKLFVIKLQNFYLKQLNNIKVTDERLEIEEVIVSKSGKVEAKTLLVSPTSGNVEMKFRFYRNKKRGWVVYDAVIEGVSITKSWQTQLAGILKSKSIDELLTEWSTEQ